jgi:putative transposase
MPMRGCAAPWRVLHGCHLAALQGSLPAQRQRRRAQAARAVGARRGQDHLHRAHTEATQGAAQHALQVLEPRFPNVAEQLRAAENDVLAYLTFPPDHRRSISSTNAIERLNAEIDRRAKVVGIFPNSASLLLLTTAVVQDQHDVAGRSTPLQSAVDAAGCSTPTVRCRQKN